MSTSFNLLRTRAPLILASTSPRRHKFLHDLGIVFSIDSGDVDETPARHEQPAVYALRMAREKALTVAERSPDAWVIGADTVVALPDGTLLGKPADDAAALDMLSRLSNSTHLVMTGVCLTNQRLPAEESFVETTEVTFHDVPEDVLQAYIRTGEPSDKAGAYGIQGIGSFLVSSIHGSCTNVIGLPVSRMVARLLANGIVEAAS